MKTKGTIGVTTQNIFPVIKKFLYSDHEIFLRELVSNAVDATQKIKALAAKGDFKEDLGDLTIRISADKDKHTLTISDRGIGMTAEEVDKYINQIAFSSAGEFLEKYKDQINNMIGHFGLGFYSSFMVAKKVEIVTKSWQEGAEAVKWTCKGTPEYSMDPVEKADRGTDIILYLYSEYESYAEEYKVSELLTKYCRFLPVEIAFGKEKEWKDGKETELDKDHIVNDTNPLWTRKPADLKEEDYKEFYRKLYPMAEEPLFWIHLNVDYPFNLTGILYFPKVKRNVEIQKDKIQLYCNQVFVTDSVEGIVPDFLTLLHGVIDSPDIPLNVSRSYLQSDASVKKISGYIMKKVSDKLEELFKKDREGFEKKWDDIRVFIMYGMITEEKFFDRAQKFLLYKNSEGKYFTKKEYEDHIKTQQTDKDKNLIILYASDVEEQHAYIESAREKGYDVVILDGILDSHFINNMEQKEPNTRFTRVDSDTVDKLIKKDEETPSKLDDKQKDELKPVIERNINQEKFSVIFENLSESDVPFMITRPEFMRRMKDMSALGGGMMGMENFPDQSNLVINTNHALMTKILNVKEAGDQDKIVKQAYDLALLSQNMLKGPALTEFVKRSIEMID